jgi:hypothetical protein
VPAHERPESEISVVAGIMPSHFVRPIARWGTQTRYKCRHCTCYMGKPQNDGVMVCSRCHTIYRPYSHETYAMVVPDDVSA